MLRAVSRIVRAVATATSPPDAAGAQQRPARIYAHRDRDVTVWYLDDEALVLYRASGGRRRPEDTVAALPLSADQLTRLFESPADFSEPFANHRRSEAPGATMPATRGPVERMSHRMLALLAVATLAGGATVIVTGFNAGKIGHIVSGVVLTMIAIPALLSALRLLWAGPRTAGG